MGFNSAFKWLMEHDAVGTTALRPIGQAASNVTE